MKEKLNELKRELQTYLQTLCEIKENKREKEIKKRVADLEKKSGEKI